MSQDDQQAAMRAGASAESPEPPESSGEPRGGGRREKYFYIIRTLTTLCALGVAFAYVLKYESLTGYHVFVFSLALVYPHVGHLLARRLESHRTIEHITLLFDAFVCGSMIYIVGFSTLPSLVLVLIALVNPIAFSGFALLGWTSLAFAAAIGLPTWLYGPHFEPRDVPAITAAAAVFLIAYYALFAHAVFLRTVALQASRRDLRQQKITIEIEKKRADALLLSILPRAAAREFERTGTVARRRLEGATLVAVSFEALAQAGDEASMNRLNSAFQALDAILTRHGLEGIKSLGGTYLAVAGLAGEARHAPSALAAAEEVRRHFEEGNLGAQARGEPTVACRIAVHSGPLMAGMVETRKLGYDLFGPTVAGVDALLRECAPGEVRVSESAHAAAAAAAAGAATAAVAATAA